MNKPNSNTNCSSNNLRVGNHWSHSSWRLRSGTKRTREQSETSGYGRQGVGQGGQPNVRKATSDNSATKMNKSMNNDDVGPLCTQSNLSSR
eukprot:scaffold19888_cov33-Cyclotella_meneghiniana.AAC.2